MNPVRLIIQSLKYYTFPSLGCKDIGIQKLMFVAKTRLVNFESFIFRNFTENFIYSLNVQISLPCFINTRQTN